MRSYFKRLEVKKRISDKQLEVLIRNLFEHNPRKAFSHKRLIQLYGQHGKGRVEKILMRLITQRFLFKYKYGIQMLYVKNPFKR